MSKLAITLETINAVRAEIKALHPDDPDLWADTLEGETDLHEWLRWAYRKIEDERGNIDALQEQISNRQSRVKSCKARQASLRGVMMSLLNAAQETKVTLPEATISRRVVAAKPIVSDPDKLPDKFVTITRKPDLMAIKRAEKLPAGVVMSNGGETISIRTK